MNKIKFMDGSVRTYQELASELKKKNYISFFTDDMYYSCWWSDSNNGWYYVIYQVEDLKKNDNNDYITDDLDDEFEFDGGLCTGSPINAIEMMLF